VPLASSVNTNRQTLVIDTLIDAVVFFWGQGRTLDSAFGFRSCAADMAGNYWRQKRFQWTVGRDM